MGSIIIVTCRSCGETSSQTDGRVMLGANPRCDRCGRTTFVSAVDLNYSEPPGDATSDAERQRRLELIRSVVGCCECGGSFSEDAPIRCMSCRSTDIDAEAEILID